MDSSPLVKAHDHARAAAVATRQSSDTTVAINEHTLAAGEFANAAKTTSSVEALRTLKLLEEHHRKLAEILKLPPEQVSSQPGDGGDLNEKESDIDVVVAADARKDSSPADAAVSKAMAGPALMQRYATRETSSIASNLASARGIRSKFRGQPLSPSVSNDQAPGNVEPNLRRDGSRVKMQNIIENNTNNQPGRPAWVPPSMSKQESPGKSAMSPSKMEEQPMSTPKDDGGYARFYSTFGNLINKISAPLAFAGLPLIQEEPSATSPAGETPNMSPTRPPRGAARTSPAPSIMEPDMSKIYSRATLRALARDGHVATDSFYVVPSTGHTMSYANILSYAEKEKRRLEASAHGGEPGISMHDEDDDFVDAREGPASLGAGVSARRRIGRGGHTDRDVQNFIEELSLENKSLKDMLDKLTKRLHTFEASAQSMAESYRMMRPGSPAPPGSSNNNNHNNNNSSSNTKAHEEAAARRNHELEEQLTSMAKQMERLEKDNRKMQKTLEKYREKWEALKAGAKARREAQVTTESIEDAQESVY